MEELQVTLVQTQLHWEQPAENLAMFKNKLESISADSDLIVLPEMFTTGFSMNPDGLASQTEIYAWVHELSKKCDAAIYGSVMFKDGDSFLNRGIFMRPDGQKDVYDKRHTFTLAGEEKVYDRGNHRTTVEYLGWKINLQICYDLRFPVWSRNTDDYDLILYVANWPQPRVNAWDALLRARAIENMSYCIGVNRVGKDGNQMPYVGHSQCFDPLGAALITEAWEEEGMKHVTLSRKHITETRKKLRFLNDRDRFTLG
jgi:predicted amidohydrolase